MVEQAIGRIAHRANKRVLVRDLRHLGEDLGDVDARHVRVDGLEGASDLLRGVVLRIPEVEVARPALEIHEDHALGLAPAGTAGQAAGVVRRGGLHLEHRAERQAEQARGTDPEDVAPGAAEVAVAEILAAGSGYEQHGGPAFRLGRVREVCQSVR